MAKQEASQKTSWSSPQIIIIHYYSSPLCRSREGTQIHSDPRHNLHPSSPCSRSDGEAEAQTTCMPVFLVPGVRLEQRLCDISTSVLGTPLGATRGFCCHGLALWPHHQSLCLQAEPGSPALAGQG